MEYVAPMIEFIQFEAQDVITASGDSGIPKPNDKKEDQFRPWENWNPFNRR